jgi:hypothetical protein
MTDPAAFQATFSDFRVVKGRKVCQWVFETPIEAADAALEALGGIPQPHEERWAAIARIVPQASVVRQQLEASVALIDKPPKERRTWSALSYAEQAGIRCNEPDFWRYLSENVSETPVSNAEIAADCIRAQCSVRSRADIKPGTRAGRFWASLDETYILYSNRQPF